MQKRADGVVPLCDLAAREKTSVSGVFEELLQGWLEGTHKLEGYASNLVSASGRSADLIMPSAGDAHAPRKRLARPNYPAPRRSRGRVPRGRAREA